MAIREPSTEENQQGLLYEQSRLVKNLIRPSLVAQLSPTARSSPSLLCPPHGPQVAPARGETHQQPSCCLAKREDAVVT